MILPTALNNAAVVAAEEVAIDDEEWDKTLTDHLDVGSTGQALSETRIAALNAMALSA